MTKMEISSPHSTNTKIFKASGSRRRRKSSGDLPSASRSAKKSSIYRGVTRHKLTGRYEAHIWDKNYLNESQNKKGKQVYLGAYDTEETAARNYDLAALKYWGTDTTLNFPVKLIYVFAIFSLFWGFLLIFLGEMQVANYDDDYKEMQGMSKEDYLASLRRRSSGFSRGASKYRGVARHHYNGRWEARIGRINGNKYLYLGTFNNEEEAAQAYDRAALVYRGSRAVTNFDINQYTEVRTQSSEPLPLPSQHQNLAHHLTLSNPITYSFDGTMAMVDDDNDLSWSSPMGSSYETFSISDLFFDINVSDDDGGVIDDIERLFDESHFSVNGEDNEKSMGAISSEIISTSLIGSQHFVEKEMGC